MKPFAAPLDDILFSIEHLAGAARLPAWDGETTGQIASHFAAFAEAEIAPLDAPGDRQGCSLSDGKVTMPDGFGPVYAAYAAQGWPGLTVPERFGGQGMSAISLAITSEIFSGACHSLQMVTGLVPGAVRTLIRFGTDAQQATYIPLLASGEMLATMCLTEPGAGSDLSRVRCTAVDAGDGSWVISGQKIFISGGNQDLSDNILHLVLARTSDDGVRGLSLFLCTDAVDKNRSAITVTRIEEKMGLHASPTCQLEFDQAVGELIGKPGEGLKAMFTMMNHARLDVALQGVAHAARAYDVASAYAHDRIQGKRADGQPAQLADHADVARMLTTIDGLAMSARAIVHIAYSVLEAGDNPDLVEFLTPVAKYYCSDAGTKAAEMGMQVLGGYGYLQEYRLEQSYRDARITSIYEGANGIHSRMVVTRLLAGASGDAFEAFISAEVATDETGSLAACLQLWMTARAAVLTHSAPDSCADDFMHLTIEVLRCCVAARMSRNAAHHPDPTRIEQLATDIIRTNGVYARTFTTLITDTAVTK